MAADCLASVETRLAVLTSMVGFVIALQLIEAGMIWQVLLRLPAH